MKKHLILLLLAAAFSFQISAQTHIIAEDVSGDTIIHKTGPNRLHFSHLYLGFGFLADKAETGAEVKYGNTNQLDFGWRYKLRVCNFYAVGTDLALTSYNFRLQQNAQKTLPDTLINDRERFSLSVLSLGFYNRFNFDKRRGNYVGNFLDVGIHGQWHMGLSHYTKNKMPNGNVVEVTTTKLKYYETWGWGLHARLGFNRWVISANYRMSDLFKPQDALPELPRLSVGIQVGLH